MRVAAYQAPLLPSGSMDGLDLIRARVRWCEANGISVMCCPEAILGGLADHANEPERFAIEPERLDSVLAPLASDTVTVIVGFTELAASGKLYNSAAVFQRGSVSGLYRKLYPAINRSAYEPGWKLPVFTSGELVFGIVICNDSNYPEPARLMAARGACVLFVPTNNALSAERDCKKIAAQARNVDIARATENSVWVVRADVSGESDGLLSYGSSGIVDPDGMILQTARQMSPDLIVAQIDTN